MNISSFREAREKLSFFHFLNCAFILPSNMAEKKVWFLYLTGATESKIFVQELLKTLGGVDGFQDWTSSGYG